MPNWAEQAYNQLYGGGAQENASTPPVPFTQGGQDKSAGGGGVSLDTSAWDAAMAHAQQVADAYTQQQMPGPNAPTYQQFDTSGDVPVPFSNPQGTQPPTPSTDTTTQTPDTTQHGALYAPIQTGIGVLDTLAAGQSYAPLTYDIPALVKGAQDLGGALHSVPILSGLLDKAGEALQGYQENIGNPVAGLAGTQYNTHPIQSTLAPILGNEAASVAESLVSGQTKPQDLLTPEGLTKAALQNTVAQTPLTVGAQANADLAQQKFQHGDLAGAAQNILQAVQAQGKEEYAAQNPVQQLANSLLFDPLNFAGFEAIGHAQQFRQAAQATGNVEKITEGAPFLAKIWEAVNPLPKVTEANQLLNLGELGAATQDATKVTRYVNPLTWFTSSPLSKGIDVINRVQDYIKPLAASEGLTYEELKGLLAKASEAANKGEITPALQQILKDKGITNSPDFQRMVNLALNFVPSTESEQAYEGARKLSNAVEHWLTGPAKPTIQALQDTLMSTRPFKEIAADLPQQYQGAFNRFHQTLEAFQTGKNGVGVNELRGAFGQLQSDIEQTAKLHLSADLMDHGVNVMQGFTKLPEQNLAEKFINKIRPLEYTLFLATNPHSVVVNTLGNWTMLGVHGVNPLETVNDIKSYFGRAYGSTDINSIIGGVGDALRAVTKDARYTTNAPYGGILPKALSNNFLAKAWTASENRARLQAFATGFRRAYEQALKYGDTLPRMPAELEGALKALGGDKALASTIKKLESSLNASEMRAALREPFPMWQAYADTIAPELQKVFDSAGIKITVTPDNLDALIHGATGDRVNEALANAIRRSKKGEDFFKALEDEKAALGRRHTDWRAQADAFQKEHFPGSGTTLDNLPSDAQVAEVGQSNPTAYNQPPPRQAQAPTMKPVEGQPRGGLAKDIPPSQPPPAEPVPPTEPTPPAPPSAPGGEGAAAPTGISLEAIKQRAAAITQPAVDAGFVRQLKAIAESDPVRLAKVPAINANAPMESVTELLDVARKQGQKWVDALPELLQERAQWIFQHADLYRDPEQTIANFDSQIRLLTGGKRGLNFDELTSPTTRDGSNIGEWLKQWYADRGEQFPRPVNRRAGSLAERTDQLAESRGRTGVANRTGEVAGNVPGASAPSGEANPVNDVAQQAAPEAVQAKIPKATRGKKGVPKYDLNYEPQPLDRSVFQGKDAVTPEEYAAQTGKPVEQAAADFATAELKGEITKGDWRGYRLQNAAENAARGIDPYLQSRDLRSILPRFNGPEAAADPTLKGDLEAAMANQILDILAPAVAQDAANYGGRALNASMNKLIEDYIKVAEPAQVAAKQAAAAMGRWYQGHTVLNYSNRWNIDDAMSFYAPFTFYPIHMAANLGQSFIDTPALLNAYARLQQSIDQYAQKNLPSRFAHKIMIPLPFLPQWMGGGVAIDPFASLLPVRSVFGLDALERATYSNLNSDQPPDTVSFLSDMYSPHMPYKLAWNLLTGDKASIEDTLANLPMVRMAKAAGLPYNTQVAGLYPFRSKYDDFYIKRALGDMLANGEITQQDMTMALLTHKGDVWQQALDKSRLQNYTVPILSGFTGFTGKILPAGEQKYIETKLQYDNLKQQLLAQYGASPDLTPEQAAQFLKDKGEYGKGGKLSAFLQQNPEMARGDALASGSADLQGTGAQQDEKMYRDFLQSAVWDKWRTASNLQKAIWRQQLGDNFINYFDVKTPDYTKITTPELLGWANALKIGLPDTSNNPNITPQTPDPYKLTFPTDAQNKAYQAFYDDVKNTVGWDKIHALEQQYYGISDKKARANFLKTPDGQVLKAEWDTEAKFYEDNPDILKVMEQVGLKKIPTTANGVGAAPTQASALQQAVAAAGLNWDQIDKWKSEYNSLPKGTGARTEYLKRNPGLLRYFQLSGAIYNTDAQLVANDSYGSGSGYSSSKLPVFKYNAPRVYNRPANYGPGRGHNRYVWVTYKSLMQGYGGNTGSSKPLKHISSKWDNGSIPKRIMPRG